MSAPEAAGAALSLRDYQRGGIDALAAGWAGGKRRQAIVWPTGAGKTVGFAELIRLCAAAGGRSLVLAHREELLEQAKAKIHDAAPGLRVCVAQGARSLREIPGKDAVVASVQSFRSVTAREALVSARFMLIIVDECHHATADTYMNILRDLGAFRPAGEAGPLVAGFTATMVRGDKVALGEVWEDVVHRVPITELIRRGFLVNPRGVRVRIAGLDLRRVKRSGGDWQGGAMGQALHDCMAPEAIARAYAEKAADRRGFVFVPSVEFAHELAPVLTAHGIPAVALDGGTDKEVRKLELKRFRAGETQALVNCDLFTEGTDIPEASVAVMAAPTSSSGRYVQRAGRVLRPFPGKRDALILDVVGVTGKHRLASLVDLMGGERVERLTAEEREELRELADELDLLEMDALLDKPAEDWKPTLERLDGELVYEEVDLFERSHQQWLKTYRGVWFLSAGDEVVSLVPLENGRFDVARMPLKTGGGSWVIRDCELSYAMSWGERTIVDIESHLPYRTAKKAGWRESAPSPDQKATAARWGLPVVDGMNRGDVSDALSVHTASRRLDHLPMFAGVK